MVTTEKISEEEIETIERRDGLLKILGIKAVPTQSIKKIEYVQKNHSHRQPVIEIEIEPGKDYTITIYSRTDYTEAMDIGRRIEASEEGSHAKIRPLYLP